MDSKFKGPILVTGAAGRVGAVGRIVVELLRQRALPVRALVRREDERADALRATGAEVVVGDLTRGYLGLRSVKSSAIERRDRASVYIES